MKKLIIAAALVAACAQSWAQCYSEGVRVGDVQKFSQKGIFFKSWEGQLVMEGTRMRGANGKFVGGNIWAFSVQDPAVAKILNDNLMVGAPMALHYCQVYATLMQTDTRYIVDRAVERKQ